MSLEKILDKIKSEAQEKVDKILTDAREKAKHIENETLNEARIKRESILTQARQNAKNRENRMIQMAYLSGRKDILTEKQKAINAVFNAALSRLAGLNPGKYKFIIRNLLLKAVRSGREEIIVSSKDKKILDWEWLKGINKDIIKERDLPGELKFSKETREIKGGFILKEGKIEINSSFEAILKYNQNKLESELAEILFGNKS